MNPNGTVNHEASCASPCRIIDLSYGGNMAYTSQSIVGAAFEDAIRGKLNVADWARAEIVQPMAPPVPAPAPAADRKSGVEGKSVSGRVDPGGRRIIKKKKKN